MKHAATTLSLLLVLSLSPNVAIASQSDAAETETQTETEPAPSTPGAEHPTCAVPNPNLREAPNPTLRYHERLSQLRAARRPAREQARLALLARARAEQLGTAAPEAPEKAEPADGDASPDDDSDG